MYCSQLLVLNQQKWRLNGKERLLESGKSRSWALIGVTEVLFGTTSSKEDESESLVRGDWGLVAGAASLPSRVPGSLNAKYPERVVSGEKAPEAINDRTRTNSLKGGARRSRE